MITPNNDEIYMQRAIVLSEIGMQQGAGGPFGCVIVKDNIIIGEGFNSVLSTKDPTAHAEVVAIRNACNHIQSRSLEGCTVYTSCEPCPMCLGAIYWAHADKVIYANTRKDAADIGFDDSFIYDQINTAPRDRALPMKQYNSDTALQVFKKWTEKIDKQQY